VEFAVPGFEDVRPRALNLSPDRRHADVAIVGVRSRSAVVTRGRVRDAAGEPLPGALVLGQGNPRYTGPDGAFEVFGRGRGATLDLRFEHPDCVSRSLPGILPGTQGLDVVLARGRPLQLLLLQAGEAVTAGIVVLQAREAARRSDWRVVRAGPFVDGLVVIGAAPPGRYDLLVAPGPAGTAAAAPAAAHLRQVIEIDAATPSPFPVQLPTACARTLQVLRDGVPIAGVTAELLAGNAGPPDLRTLALPAARWSNYRDHALLAQEVATGKDGTAELRGPGGETFALRVRGDRIVETLVHDVRLDAAAPLVVAVAQGGTLHGALVPPDAFAALAASTGAQPPASRLFVRLVGTVPGQGVLPPQRGHGPGPAFPVRPDGSFTIGGIPAGEWTVELDLRPLPPRTGFFREPLGTIRVAGAAVLRERYEVGQHVPATLAGIAHIGGLAGSGVQVQIVVERDGRPPANFGGTTGAGGRFEVAALPGRWLVRFSKSSSPDPDAVLPPSAFRQVAWPEALVLAPGERRVQDFDLAPAEVRLRFVDQQGRPVRGLHVEARTSGGLRRAGLGHTDADGRSKPLWAEVGRFHLFALPRRLQDGAAARDESRLRGVEPWDLAIEVGVVDIVAAGSDVVVTLPPAWEQ
jgi:hypothetical protein